MTVHVLIADDEPLARERLSFLVVELGYTVCGEAADGNAVLELVAMNTPDVVLLDIEMPGCDGIEVARNLEQAHPELSVVMVTAYSEHAVAAFDAAVHDYVLKPVRKERLAKALERAVRRKPGRERSAVPVIKLTVGRVEKYIPLDELDCFVAEQGYVLAKSATLEGFCELCLQELEEYYGQFLIRAHRGCLVVISSIDGLSTQGEGKYRLLFRDGLSPVTVSRRQYSVVREYLRNIVSIGRR